MEAPGDKVRPQHRLRDLFANYIGRPPADRAPRFAADLGACASSSARGP